MNSNNDNINIGFDPLAWMQDTESDTEAESADTTMVVTSDDGFRINLAGKTDIGSAEQLKNELSAALNQNAPVILIAKEVERADGAALQLLTAFIQKLVENEHELIWDAPSEKFINTVNIVGLREAMQLP